MSEIENNDKCITTIYQKSKNCEYAIDDTYIFFSQLYLSNLGFVVSDLHNCIFTCKSLVCRIFSVSVTVEPAASKSQVAFANKVEVATFCSTSLNLTFGSTVTPPFSIVDALKSAAEMYFEAN